MGACFVLGDMNDSLEGARGVCFSTRTIQCEVVRLGQQQNRR